MKKRQEPGFISGMSRTLDVGSTVNKIGSLQSKSDTYNMKNDWAKIGNDIRFSMNKFGVEHGQTRNR